MTAERAQVVAGDGDGEQLLGRARERAVARLDAERLHDAAPVGGAASALCAFR
jgi:hypothetical protein